MVHAILTLAGYLASLAAALWIYIMGYFVLKDQAYPFALPIRFICILFVWCVTVSVTTIPPVIFGGFDSCSKFHPSIPDENGRSFHDLWTDAIVRVIVTSILAILAGFISLADHPESTYIRQSLRCVMFYWLAVRCIDGFTRACTGTDENNDGLRDNVMHRYPIAYQGSAFGVAVSFLGDIWCIQLVIEKLVAFQEAFGENLPCMKAISCLSLMMKVCMVLVGVSVLLHPAVRLAVDTLATFCLFWLVVLVCWAYSLPMQSLRDARRVDREDDVMGEQLLKETRFAMRVIGAAQVGFVVAGLSMAVFLLFHGLYPLIKTNAVMSTYTYAGLADSLGNSLCVALLCAPSLCVPKISCCRPQAVSIGVEDSRVQEDCTCGQQLGKTLGRGSFPAPASTSACEACRWEVKVAELANRRVSVAQLLNFYTQLGSGKGQSTPAQRARFINTFCRRSPQPTMWCAMLLSQHLAAVRQERHWP